MDYRKATTTDLNLIWDKDIAKNLGDNRWVKWKEQYIEYNKSGKAITFVAVNNNTPIGQITLILSDECKAVSGKPKLCDNKTVANFNAFRIDKQFEGQGHISRLVKLAEAYAKGLGIKSITIGCEAKETRNLAIYLHFGYTKFVMHEFDEGELILYYLKEI